MPGIQYRSDNKLWIEDLDLTAFCQSHPTPFYLYSKHTITQNCTLVNKLTSNFDLLPCYALKANFNPQLIRLIHGMGFGADVVSAGELYFALKAGIEPEKIVFAGVGKTAAEIEEAISAGIHSLNVESESELDLIYKIARKLQKKVTIAIRVNPDIDPRTHPYISTGLHSNKFGVTRAQAIQLYQQADQSPFLEPNGIHVHIGSQIDNSEPYVETAKFLLDMRTELVASGIKIKYVDLGGGIGINYQDQLDHGTNSQTYIKDILPKVLTPFRGENLKLLIELGRSIIGSAGFLVTKVLYTKRTPEKKFIIVDAAMNNLIRPCLYQAYHQLLTLDKFGDQKEIVDVVGPVCETSDFFAKDRELPKLNVEDILVISGAGAYGQALASNYNLRPILPEYLVDQNSVIKIFNGNSIKTLANQFEW